MADERVVLQRVADEASSFLRGLDERAVRAHHDVDQVANDVKPHRNMFWVKGKDSTGLDKKNKERQGLGFPLRGTRDAHSERALPRLVPAGLPACGRHSPGHPGRGRAAKPHG